MPSHDIDMLSQAYDNNMPSQAYDNNMPSRAYDNNDSRDDMPSYAVSLLAPGQATKRPCIPQMPHDIICVNHAIYRYSRGSSAIAESLARIKITAPNKASLLTIMGFSAVARIT